MSKESIVQISLRANEELIKRTKQQSTQRFYMVGKSYTENTAPDGAKKCWEQRGIDFIDTFAAMTRNEQMIVRIMKDCIKWDKPSNSFDYIVKLDPDSVHFMDGVLDTMKYETFLKGMTLLFKKDIVRKVTRHHYMFNPDFFLINGEQKAYFTRKWNESKQYSSKDTK